MSNFTTEVRWICESTNLDYKPNETPRGYNNINESIEQGREKIFDFDYPLFDPLYKETLETKIIRHFYTREIGFETVGLWKLKLCDKLNLIMPYYNQLYESCLLEFDPLIDVNYRRTGNKNDRKTNLTNENNQETTSGSETHAGNETTIGNKNENKTMNEELDRRENNTNIKTENRTNNTSETNNEQNTNNKTGNSVKTENYNKQYDGTDTGTNSESNNETANTTKSELNTRNKNGEDNKWDLYSDTPQSGVHGLEGFNGGSGSVAGGAYLTNARRNTDEYSDTENDRTNAVNIEHGTQNKTGNTSITYDYDTVERNNSVDVNKEEQNETRNGSKTKNINENNNDTNIGNSNRNDVKAGNETLTGNDSKIKSNNMNIGSNKTKEQLRNANGLSTGNQDYFETIIGKRGAYSYSKMLDEFRKTFLNIDLMIINELEPLFMGLWE